MSTPFISDNMQHVFAQEGEHKTNKVRELIDVITDVKRRAMTNVRKYDIRGGRHMANNGMEIRVTWRRRNTSPV